MAAAAHISQGAAASLSAADMEFVAEDELIDIIPNFTLQEISFLSGTYGPFRPRVAVKVPLWLGIALQQRNKCSLILPPWLAPEGLERRHTQVKEGQNDGVLHPMPFHYQEISSLLFKINGDVNNSRVKLKDIEEIRDAKLQLGLKRINGSQPAIKLNNVSAMEINALRPLLTQTMDAFHFLSNASQTSHLVDQNNNDYYGGGGGGGGGDSGFDL